MKTQKSKQNRSAFIEKTAKAKKSKYHFLNFHLSSVEIKKVRSLDLHTKMEKLRYYLVIYVILTCWHNLNTIKRLFLAFSRNDVISSWVFSMCNVITFASI